MTARLLTSKASHSRRTFLQTTAATIVGWGLSQRADSQDVSETLRLITRADDLGCARSLNRAVVECVTEGIARNVSVLAPSPFIEEGAEALAEIEDVCVGLHTALNSEWTDRRWGPVAPVEQVPSLVDDNGFLHQYPQDLAQADADEALIEFTAQLEHARALGLDLIYADSHMGAVNNVEGLAEKFGDWCQEHGLIDYRDADAARLPGIPNYGNQPDRRKDPDYPSVLLDAMQAADRRRTYLIVGHPAYDDRETRGLGHRGYPGDSVASNLNLERLAYVSADTVEYCAESDVALLRYDDVVTIDK